MYSKMVLQERPEIFEMLIHTAPIFQKLFPLDCTIAVTDKEYFIADYPSKELQLNLKGKRIPDDTGIMKSIKSGEISTAIINAEVYGVPFKSVASPIKNEKGEVIGCMSLGMSMKNQEMLNEATQSLAATSEEIVASTEELASTAQELARGMAVVDLMRKEMEEQVLKTEEILTFIRDISKNSNLLGLNAAIEAARAGEAGRSFSIVAGEIRKMADNSEKSVAQIKLIIEEIKKRTLQTSVEMQKSLQFSENLADVSQEIAIAIQGLNSYIMDLENLSKII